MKFHTQFLLAGNDGELQDMCGSEGVFILDGRNNLDTMINDSFTRWDKLWKIHPRIIGFSIRKGSRFDNYKEIRQVVPRDTEDGPIW